jgi:hypothetical protein
VLTKRQQTFIQADRTHEGGERVLQLLLGSWLIMAARLCGKLFIERSRRATTCKVAQVVRDGGLVIDRRGYYDTLVIYVLPRPVRSWLEPTNDHPDA